MWKALSACLNQPLGFSFQSPGSFTATESMESRAPTAPMEVDEEEEAAFTAMAACTASWNCGSVA